jgi:simple sugar transport system ATP-binding protein
MPLLQAVGVSKSFGPVSALRNVSLTVRGGQVACLLGDNGAGKSTLIKILAGALRADSGRIEMLGREMVFHSPRAALDAGIATLYQDLAVVSVMPVFRNFFLGNEPVRGRLLLRRFDIAKAIAATRQELAEIGIDLDDASRPIATLSGGERQCVAIARAVHFGAKVLILDEPTSALGVHQSQIVLRYVLQTCRHGVGVILVTHNPEHAYAVGDQFTILNRGEVARVWQKQDLTIDVLVREMASGKEVGDLSGLVDRM